MPLTPQEENLYRQSPFYHERFLAMNPRDVLFSGTIVSYGTDYETQGVYEFTYSETVPVGVILEVGMTVDIFSNLGEYIGSTRLRGHDQGNKIIKINETDRAEISMNNGWQFSVVNEFSPFPIIPYYIGYDSDGNGFIDNFIERHDYDINYTDQNINIQPQANVTSRGMLPYKPAGFNDDGETYRTVELSASSSLSLGSTVAGFFWDVKDGVYVSGNSTSQNITVRFPVSNEFRYIKLTVSSQNGKSHTCYRPIWSFDRDTYMESPILFTDFTVTKDSRGEDGRSMGFSFFGANQKAGFSEIMERSLMCFFEDNVSFGGDSPTDRYIDQYIGYAFDRSLSTQLYSGETILDLYSCGQWASMYNGRLNDINNSSEPFWYNIPGLTITKAVHYSLREYSTLLNIFNFHPNSLDNIETEAEQITGSNLWEQIKNMYAGFKHTHVSCDSLGSIVCKTPISLTLPQDRPTVAETHFMNRDWAHTNAPEIRYTYSNNISKVISRGSSYHNGQSFLYGSEAPGTKGLEFGSHHESAFQRLDHLQNAQGVLNTLSGLELAMLSNTLNPITIQLETPIDVFEPCNRELVIFSSFNNDNNSGVEMYAKQFTVTGVECSYTPNAPFKSMSITIEAVTYGEAGIVDPIEIPDNPLIEPESSFQNPQLPIIIPPMFTPEVPPITGGGGSATAMITEDGDVYMTMNFSSNSPQWEKIGTQIPEPVIAAAVDPSSPLYIGTGLDVDLIVVTRPSIYVIGDVFGDFVLAKVFDFEDETKYRSLDVIRGEKYKAAVASAYSEVGVKITKTEDLINWTSEVLVGDVAPIIYDDQAPEPSTEWEQVFDFTVDEQGWTINQNTPVGALTYIAGVGFKFERIAGSTQTRIFYDRMGAPFLNTDSTITDMEVFVVNRTTSASSTIRLALLGNGMGKDVSLPAGSGDTSLTNLTPVNVTSPNIFLIGLLTPLTAGDSYVVEKVVCKGVGFNPFEIEADYMQVFDFTQGKNGFDVDSGYPSGQTLEYVTGQGFRHTMETNASRAASFTRTYPFTPISDIFITKIRVDYDRDLNWARGSSISTGYSGNIGLGVPLGTGSGFVETSGWIARRSLDQLSVIVNHQWGSSIPNPTGYWVTIKKLTIWGISKTGMGNPLDPGGNPPGVSFYPGAELATSLVGPDEYADNLITSAFNAGKDSSGKIINLDTDVVLDYPDDLFIEFKTGSGLAGDIHVVAPYESGNTSIYFGSEFDEMFGLYKVIEDNSTPVPRERVRVDDIADISYGPLFSGYRFVSHHSAKQNNIISAGDAIESNGMLYSSAIFRTWLNSDVIKELLHQYVDEDDGIYRRVALSRTGNNDIFVFGTKGRVGIAKNYFEKKVEDKRGNTIGDIDGEVMCVFIGVIQ